MIIVDTNVISELWKPEPDQRVLAWVDAQSIETLYLSVVTVAELRYGLAAMPAGKRRTLYQERLEQSFLPLFAGRVLAFDLETTEFYVKLMLHARQNGHAISIADGYIAASAARHNMMVATRDIHPFVAGGVEVINPWESATSY